MNFSRVYEQAKDDWKNEQKEEFQTYSRSHLILLAVLDDLWNEGAITFDARQDIEHIFTAVERRLDSENL